MNYSITDWPTDDVAPDATHLPRGYGYVTVDRPMQGNKGRIEISLPADGAPVYAEPVEGRGYSDDDPAADLATLIRAQEYLRVAIARYGKPWTVGDAEAVEKKQGKAFSIDLMPPR